MNSRAQSSEWAVRPQAYEFGEFRLDLERRLLLLRANGRPLPITPRVLDTLVYLVRNPGTLVDRDTLMDCVWPDADVEPNNLSQSIAKLRRLLGESPGENRFIETVPGRGYRFIGTVRLLPTSSPSDGPGDQALPMDPETAQLYRQGLRLLQRPDAQNCRLAIECFETVLAQDPQFAHGWAWLADAHLLSVNVGHLPLEALIEVERFAVRALDLKSDLAIAHAVLGTVRAHRSDWSGAEGQFSTASVLDPSDAMPRVLHAGFVLHQVGHVRRALVEMREAFRLLPDDPRMLMNLAVSNCIAGMDAEALRCARLAIGFGFPEGAWPMSLVFTHAAMRAGDLRSAARHGGHLFPETLEASDVAQQVYGALGQSDFRHRAVGGICELLGRTPDELVGRGAVAMGFVEWFTLLGRIDLALEVANRSIDLGAQQGLRPPIWQTLWLPELRPLRAVRAFQSLAERLAFPSYWRRFGSPDDQSVGWP